MLIDPSFPPVRKIEWEGLPGCPWIILEVGRSDPVRSIAGARGKYATLRRAVVPAAAVGGENKPQLNPAAGGAHSHRSHRQTDRQTDRQGVMSVGTFHVGWVGQT